MAIEELLGLMTRLRDPQAGCPWDREQDFTSIAPYTIEEAYEVADAIERQDYSQLRGELGDLLFQVVFHAQLAREAGHFDFEGVVRAICDKMYRRHPHVFADARIGNAEEQSKAWEAHKALERRAAGTLAGVLDDVPVGLPALTRAAKLGKRAAGVGFDWPDWRGSRAKIDEELAELEVTIQQEEGADRMQEELGDLLFAVVNLARHLRVDPEAALRGSNARFSERIRHMENQARITGRQLDEIDLAGLEQLWEEAKQATTPSP